MIHGVVLIIRSCCGIITLGLQSAYIPSAHEHSARSKDHPRKFLVAMR
jgi:hypothetical protein